MFTIIQTLLQWNINPSTWLNEVFQFYADSKNNPLPDIKKFMPWNMSSEEKKTYELKSSDPP